MLILEELTMNSNWLTTDSIGDSGKFTKDFWENHRIGETAHTPSPLRVKRA